MESAHVTFRGGIHPNYNKELTNTLPIVNMPAPKTLVIPMSMHIGAPCTPIVKVGDHVKMGQQIGEAGGFVSADIHSSVSGDVVAVEKRLTSDGRQTLCVVIENDFKDELFEGIKANDPGNMDVKELSGLLGTMGIVGLGGATFPLRVKYAPSADNPIDYLIVNAAECEPYLSSDHALMREYPEKIIGGLKIAMKVLGQEKGYIGIEDNKQDAIEKLNNAKDDSIEIVILETKYPQGGEKQLISAITQREVPSGALPASVGCIVSNAGTIAAIYDAVYSGMPLIERIVTVTGSGIKEPKVLKFRIGTMVSEMIEFCGGLTDDIAKVILGGPMMGFAQYTTSIPATKGTSGILCLNNKDAFIEEPSNCIRCGKCTEVCPMQLMPLYLGNYAVKGDFEKCIEYNAMDCIECGSCAFTCPARRPLVASIRMAKAQIKNMKK